MSAPISQKKHSPGQREVVRLPDGEAEATRVIRLTKAKLALIDRAAKHARPQVSANYFIVEAAVDRARASLRLLS